MSKRDYIWNTLGSIVFAVSFPVLIILITRVQGAESAGIFSIAFVTAQMFMIVGNYAVRAFQASDVQRKYTFAEYRLQRYICCLLMMFLGIAYSLFRGYSNDIFQFCIVLCFYKMIDALADVYEGELQRQNVLYKAGISLAARTVTSILGFMCVLVITGNLLAASIAMCIIAGIALLCFAIIPTRNLKEKKRGTNRKNVGEIFVQCFPLFLSLFLLGYINNSPKYAMENELPYEYQTYFNALYFPSQVIYMLTGFLFKPMLLSMAGYWRDWEKVKLVTLVKKILVVIAMLTAAGMLAVYILGVPILSLVFGVNLSGYQLHAVILIAAGGLIAVVNFMYHVLTVMRKQKILMLAYIAVFLLSLIIPANCVKISGMWGACLSYVILMMVLALLLIGSFYRSIKMEEKECEF